MLFKRLLQLIVCLLLPVNAFAGELTGFVAVDTRAFIDGPQFNGQETGLNTSLVVEPEYYHVSEDGDNIFTIKPFLRVDNHDDNRTHFDLRQADWVHVNGDYELRAGVSKVFWGVIEANQLVNIVNQIDGIEDVDGEDYLGQPMIQLAALKDWGTLRFFWLPYFREGTFADRDGRLRANPYVDMEQVRYGSAAEEWHQDFALRYAHVIGDWDVGLSHFSGTSREAILTPGTNSAGQSVFIPTYDIIDQTGIDLQYTKEGWLLKFEGITRSGQGERFIASASGLEYTFFNIMDAGPDIGVLAEYHRDERDSNAPGNLFDDDVFVGSRLTMNDEDDTAILAGVAVDTQTKARAFSMEAETRVAPGWKVELDARFYAGSRGAEPLAAFINDDHVQLRVAYYF